MLKRISNKGFTLIELLATIVILSLLATVAGASVLNYYQASKEKAEEAFINEIENQVEDYISLYGSKLNYSAIGEEKNKCHITTPSYNETVGQEKCSTVILYPTLTPVGIEEIANKVSNKDFVNPSSKVTCTNDNLKIEIYRDTDYVYCFKIKKGNEDSCINKNIDGDVYIDKCATIYESN